LREQDYNFDAVKGRYILEYVVQYPTSAGIAKGGDWQGLPKGVQFKEVNFGGGVSYAVFNSNSTSSSGNITLQNTKGAERKIVLLANTGRVRIEGN
jgi:hypothetical protein